MTTTCRKIGAIQGLSTSSRDIGVVYIEAPPRAPEARIATIKNDKPKRKKSRTPHKHLGRPF
jgi:hypothetical protein